MENQVIPVIGALAGEVWHQLSANGEMSFNKLFRALKEGRPDAKESQLFMALGWLTREGKMVLYERKFGNRQGLMISLTE